MIVPKSPWGKHKASNFPSFQKAIPKYLSILPFSNSLQLSRYPCSININMKLLELSLLPFTTALPSVLSFLAPRDPSLALAPRQTCLPSQYCVLVCNAPHFAGTCNTVCGANGECRLIQNGLNNNVFSARTTCGTGVYL